MFAISARTKDNEALSRDLGQLDQALGCCIGISRMG